MPGEEMHLRVLVVDDDPMVGRALARLIGKRAHTTLLPGAKEALAALARAPADLLITDLEMPGRSGLELLTEAASRWPAVYRVLCSGNPCSQITAALEARTIEVFLPKPFELQTLAEILEAATLRRAARARA